MKSKPCQLSSSLVHIRSLYGLILFASIAILCVGLPQPAMAQSSSDYTAGLSNSSGVIQLWFNSNVNTTWVNAHYSVNGGGQLNVAMNQVATNQFTYTIAANVGDTVTYSFTYNNGGSAYDTTSATGTVPSSGGSGGTVATPSITPGGGSYTSAQSVTLTDSTSGASIYYTTDGSTPTTSSTLYTGAFTVSSSCTVNVIATASGMSNSSVATASFTIGTSSGPYTQGVTDNGSSVVIWFTPNPASSSVIVHYNANNTGQQNVYMTQGSGGQWTQSIPATPGASFTVSYSFTYNTSSGAVDTAGYTWTRSTQVATPTISPNGGTYTSSQSISLSDATSGASIYYTTDGSIPTASSTLYSGAFTITSSCTVNAIAVLSGMPSSNVATAAFTISAAQTQAATPTFSPAAGTYSSTQSVTISDTTAGSSIYYTTNGTTPTTASTLYTGPVSISSSCTLQAIAVESGMTNSAVASAVYTINNSGPYSQGVTDYGTCVQIWFTSNPSSSQVILHYTPSGQGQQNVYMTQNSSGQWTYDISATPGAAISLTYSFTYTESTGAADSSTYTWSRTTQVATPAMSPNGGTFASAQSVSMTDATSGASIYYTTDGSTPTTSSTLYTGAFTVGTSCTVKAIAVESGIANSNVASATFTINASQAAPPSIAPNGGNFTTSQSVTLTDSTTGASIYYTTNGSTPTTSSTLYTGPFTIAASCTVNAIAIASGYSNSNVAAAAFVISAPTVATPTFLPAGGTYTSTQSVTLSTSTSGASIYYTTNGSTPTTSSTLYTGAITVSANTTINAVAVANGMNNSAVGSASYTINTGTGTYAYGVTESGSTAYIWFSPNWTPTTAIAHYYITTNGVNSPQNDVSMTWDASLTEWVTAAIQNMSAGQVVHYFFTYSQPSGGNIDSPWYSYTICGNSSMCVGQVPRPIISLASGTYATAQTVSISLDPSAPTGSSIYYTLDGSAPTKNSTLYTAAITVNTAETLSAITIQPNGLQSSAATATYDISASSGGGAPAAPTFSIAPGTYNTIIGVNLLTSTMGATIHFTTDGSTPTASSQQFYGAIWLENGSTGPTTTINAISVLNGVSSPVSSATYTISANNQSTWNGYTTFNVANGTNGEYADSQIYWFILGIDWSTGQFVHVDMNGNLVPMSLSDNTVAVPGRTTGYANYSMTLAQTKSVTIPPIESARIYMSVGSPVLIQVNTNNLGQIGYAGPDLGNSTDPNLGVTFDFGEFNINQPAPLSTMPGIFCNTTRVDLFGFPIKMNVQGLDGYNATVGEPLTETRAQLFARYLLSVPTQFQGLAQAPYAPYRIVAPAHGSFNNGLDPVTGAVIASPGANSTYLDSYISSVWNQLKTTPVQINLQNGWPTFTGTVNSNNVLSFTDGLGTYNINGIPSTTEVMLGDGKLNDPSGTTPGSTAYQKQLQLQAQVCAALNRHVADQTGDKWWNSAYFYPAGSTSNWYTKFWHDHSINGLAYGLCYDDVGGYSPSIYTPSPTSVTFTIGQ